MKTFLVLSLLRVGVVPLQDGLEEKKKRLEELVKQMEQIQIETAKLVRELSGGDPSKAQALMREVTSKYAPAFTADLLRAQLEANERNASATLKAIGGAEADFRANDRDGNRVNDFWVADVSGLYRIDGGRGPIRLIDLAVATADAKPCFPLDKAGVLPNAAREHASRLALVGKPAADGGYWFKILERYQDEKGNEVKYNDGNGRNRSSFGVCAYPAEYKETGKLTFILNEENVLWSKDTAGKPLDVFPSIPENVGWTKRF